ncbi:Crp/Fnr family transcriptional regulator [Thiomonas sp.]
MPSTSLLHDLQTHTILSALQPEQLGRLLSHASEVQIPVDGVIFLQEQEADAFYVVLDGKVQIQVPAINGPGVDVQALGKWDVIGWSWLIAPYRWAFEAKALTPVTLLRFDGKAILKECEHDTDLGYALMKIFAGLMSERLHAARLRMMECWAPPGWA